MANTEKEDLCPCGSGRKFRKCHGAQRSKSRGIPAWLFFLMLAILGAGVLYYINSVGRSTDTALSPPPAPVAAPISPAGSLAANPVAVPAPVAADPVPARFENLPGFPLTDLSVEKKQKFLARANSEMCTCGCKGDTVAKCVVQDPNCQIAPALAKRILDEVQAGS